MNGLLASVRRSLRGQPNRTPTKLELVVKSAKALGIDVPPTLLARADDVIE